VGVRAFSERPGAPRTGSARALLFALALAATAAGAQPAADGVEVRKSRLLLLPASVVERTAAQQYAQMMRQAAQAGRLNTDRPQLERLRAIARALIAEAPRYHPQAARWRWEVNVIHADAVNAFCMPGGKIAFYSGILERLALDADEAAAVMGHEIAHALLEHGRARMSQQVLKNLGIAAAAIAFNLGQLSTELLAHAADLALTLPYARSQESDADLLGLELAARAGFDPRAALRLWQKMQAYAARSGRAQAPQFLSTHPGHERRLRDLENALPKVLPLYEARRAAENRLR